MSDHRSDPSLRAVPDPPGFPGGLALPGDEAAAIACVNPATGEIVARVHAADADDVDRAVEAALLAASMWRGVEIPERRRYLDALAHGIRRRAAEIADAIRLETGKPRAEALALEVLPAIEHCRYAAEHALEAISGELVRTGNALTAHRHAYYLYEPMGVIALVTPHALPFAYPASLAAFALAMGNAVVVKPSSAAPLAALRFRDLCEEAGLPEGLVHVLPARRPEAMHLVSHPRVDKVVCVGSIETGQQVMATAGCQPKPVVLALGGKHPAIVARDADIERAARSIVWGATAHAGQYAGSVERVYVEEPIARVFVDAIDAEVARLRVGDPCGGEIDVGPLISEERRMHVHRQVSDAVARGARLLRGGELPEGPGFYYPPTVLLAPPADAWILQEETLGPVVPIVVTESLERAVLLANDSAYAHSASGWTRSARVAERLLDAVQASVVSINDVLGPLGVSAATKSGYRMSGLGDLGGIAGLREMCRRRFASYDVEEVASSTFSHPQDETADRIARLVLDRLYAPNRLARLRALLGLLREPRFRERMPRRFFLRRRG